MYTVAIFGGSFAPVHKGHMEVARGILDRKLADEVWMLPCRQNPLKEDGPQMTDYDRVRELETAVQHYNRLRGKGKEIMVNPMELHMSPPSYTCHTMQILTDTYPEIQFRLAVGADSYLSFTDWMKWEWLEEKFAPIVYPRPGYEINEVKPGWTLLEGVELTDISSTKLREMIGRGEETEKYMPWKQ